jgi:hypothetical protein
MIPRIDEAILTAVRDGWVAAGRSLVDLQMPNCRFRPSDHVNFAGVDLLHDGGSRDLLSQGADHAGRAYTGIVAVRCFARQGDGLTELARMQKAVMDSLSEKRLPIYDPASVTTRADHWENAIAVWELNDAAGETTLRDSVADYPATQSGGTVMPGLDGILDKAVLFDGSGSVRFSAGFPGLEDFTVAFWVKTNPLVDPETVFRFGSDVRFLLSSSLASFQESLTTKARATGYSYDTWQHWVVGRDGAQLRMWRDGVPLALTVDLPSVASVDGEFFQFGLAGGRLDQVAVFDHILSDADVLSLYNGGSGDRFNGFASLRGTVDFGVSEPIHVGPSEYEGASCYQYNVETRWVCTIFPRA